MKLFFPTRFPFSYVLAFSGVIFAAAWAEGTDIIVAALAASFFIISGLAFNAAGGLIYPSGAYVFFLSTLSMGVGVVTKIFLGEALDSHLQNAQKSMLIYNAGMCGVYLATLINRHLRRERPLLLNVLTNVRVDQIAMGCILIGIAGPIVLPDSLVTMFNQINSFLTFAILLPVYARARETDGRSTFNWLSFGAWAYMTVFLGLLTFSKQGIFQGSVAWIVAACAAGYRITKVRLVALSVLAVVATAILTPYSQVGRQYREAPDLMDQAIYLLQHPLETRDLYAMQTELQLLKSKSSIHWFEHPQGLVDRLTMLPIDDALISITDQGHSQTLYVTATYFMNLVPHFIWPDKPNLGWGNQFAHEIGLLSRDDHSTGISFSPFADAYHEGQWMVVLFLAPLLWLMMFFVVDSVTGSSHQTVWAIFYILYFSHASAEGMMNTMVYGTFIITFGLIFASWVIARIAPLIGQLVTLPKPLTPQSAALKS